MSDRWEVSNDELMADEDFAESASGFSAYDALDFEYQVQQVADRIFNIHLDRGVRGEFIFGFDANSEGEIASGNIGLSCPGEFSLYLVQNLELKRLTDDREATGWNQAAAIRDALMTAYDQVRTTANAKGLL